MQLIDKKVDKLGEEIAFDINSIETNIKILAQSVE
jgi:hypothetical protein